MAQTAKKTQKKKSIFSFQREKYLIIWVVRKLKKTIVKKEAQ